MLCYHETKLKNQMKRIVNMQGVGPSISGAFRIRVTFFDMTERHFYMWPDGRLFIPPNHTRDMFSDPQSATKEWDWVQKTWLKPGSDAKFIARVMLPMSCHASDLCQRIVEDPSFYDNELRKKLKKDESKVTLGTAFQKTLDKVRDNLPSQTDKFNKRYGKKTA